MRMEALARELPDAVAVPVEEIDLADLRTGRPGLEPQSADHVAEKILELVESGEEQSVLVPAALLRC